MGWGQVGIGWKPPPQARCGLLRTPLQPRLSPAPWHLYSHLPNFYQHIAPLQSNWNQFTAGKRGSRSLARGVSLPSELTGGCPSAPGMALPGKLLRYAQGAEPSVGLGGMNPPLFPSPRRFTAAELSSPPRLPHLCAFPPVGEASGSSFNRAGAEDFGREGSGWRRCLCPVPTHLMR